MVASVAVIWPASAASVDLPPLTNSWDISHLYISIKDTNGVIINANDRFLEAIQVSFPEIQTLADLIGKDDFYFYPANLANKYRADDLQVMQNGAFWETLEQNGVKGNLPTYVYVSKTPLRDSSNHVAALLIQWYDIPAPNQTVLPVFTNVWDQTNIMVIDKDTNSVFLNANELFLSTLRPSFPIIHSVTNLLGRDDYYFYPTNMAEKFRSDDRRVILSGQPWTGDEENQPLGGNRIYSHVTKTPLRDASNQVFGLRITAFVIPDPSIRPSGNGIQITWAGDATGYSLQQSSSLNLAAVWRRVDTLPQVTNGIVRLALPLSNSASFFRLIKN